MCVQVGENRLLDIGEIHDVHGLDEGLDSFAGDKDRSQEGQYIQRLAMQR